VHRHTEKCVWCDLEGGFTIPHLLRDCHHGETHLRLTLLDVQNDLANAGVEYTAHCDAPHYRQLWYLFMCGFNVPHAFVGLRLDKTTHLARSSCTAHSAAMKPTLSHYRKAMKTTGKFVFAVVDDHGLAATTRSCRTTRATAKDKTNSERTTIHRFNREAVLLST
jgi:hypothetical protein